MRARLFNRHTSKLIGHSLLCLLALAMTIRALIPAGFMPDQGALHDGRLEMVLCTVGGGFSTVSVDLDSHHPDHDHTQPDCPFGILVHQALDVPVIPSLAPARVIAFGPPLAPSLNRSLPPLPALGPPLGSRAPPSNLG